MNTLAGRRALMLGMPARSRVLVCSITHTLPACCTAPLPPHTGYVR